MRLPDGNAMFPRSCDTLVALSPRTAGGATLFAKNSDRPPGECQPLFFAPRQTHLPGTTVTCQYLTIPQARETLAVLGSRPWWLWGFEHGANECRVAIGNEALHAREVPGEAGFLGMDLVRLGLERGRTAGEAKRVITDLLERFGQGGSASVDTDRRYHNGFMIADPGEAWVVVTSAMHMPRTVACLRAAGWNDAIPWPDDFESLPGIGGIFTARIISRLNLLDLAAHEWIGLAYSRASGRTAEFLPTP